ncbi:acyl-CoA dehydrogenase family protein [Pseudonocardia sp. C8]|nr:acyl-CoA dehydrogenase family protein [Pseudonocardia sp. C8]
MDAECAQLSALADEFFTREAVPRAAKWEAQRHVDREFWTLAGGVGLLSCSVPTEFGGSGGSVAHDLAVIDAQARVTDYAFGGAVHSGVVTHYLLDYGTDEQKRRWLPSMVTGETVGAIALTEPDAGSDLKALRTRAVRDGDDWVLDGSKTFITNGSIADLVVVAAVTEPGAGSRGISLFLVDARVPGFTVTRVLDKIGQHGSDTSELSFVGVRLPASALLGEPGRGFAMMMEQLPQERLFAGVMAVGAMTQAVALTVDYTSQRRAFGAPLSDLQNTRFEVAECATLTEVARTFVDDAIVRHLDDSLDLAAAAMVKLWTTDVQGQVVDRCLQLFGGYGYMREYPIGRLWVDARAQRIYGGSNEIMKELITRSLLPTPARRG